MRVGDITYGVLKNAPTLSLLPMVKVQVVLFVGVQFAVQPAKEDPAAGVAVSVTVEFTTKFPVHVDWEPQLNPLGELVIVPSPAPSLYTESVGELPTGAVTMLIIAVAVISEPVAVVANAVIALEVPGGPTLVTTPV